MIENLGERKILNLGVIFDYHIEYLSGDDIAIQ